ncbi:PRD domain-containing protein [Carnobacteriaceae bacterium zg-ZUI240]|nr:PRD domain-containing protein [Carnobacteriaceae bacterium zg-ZUI240]
MQIQKVFNNNIVLALSNQQEIVVMGKGIGFQKKVGDELDTALIEKTFVLQDNDTAMISQVYVDMPEEEIDVVLAIIKLAEATLQESFQSNLYITLADHLKFAFERVKKGLVVKNPLSYEVKKFYPVEHELGRQALALVKERLNVTLDESEATAIALHIVNAEKDGPLLERTVQITRIVQEIMDVVRLHYGRELDESDVSYNRFTTHLQYFAQRIVTKTMQGTNDSFLFEQVRANYPEAFACTDKIKVYAEEAHHFAMGRDEQVYLTIHIQKLMNK